MIVVALLVCMFFGLGSAHVYERCELARELTSLGVDKEHLATWVCIAFHESRFDTSAQNHGSGDHGILQISELYWCGPGKACGVPCSAFRDEDISDDLECAKKIYKEHTRLQGNGFLAWVVYPLHCKSNAKKYLADCDISVKNGTENIEAGARSLKSRGRNLSTPKPFHSYSHTNRPKPSYLAINSIFEVNYSKETEENYKTNARNNWLNYKVDNIDSLSLPMNNNGKVQFLKPHLEAATEKSTTPTITSVDPENLVSPYLAIQLLFEGSYYDKFLENNRQRTDWLDYKVENINALKLPVLNKNGTIKLIEPSTTSYTPNTIINTDPDNLKSPYLAIKLLFEGSFYKQFLEKNKRRTDWSDYKVDNIDSLKLPVLKKDGEIQLIAPSTTSYKPKLITTTMYRNEKLLPSFLAVKSLFGANNYKQFQDNSKQRINWLDYKIDNVDSLKLPVTNENEEINFIEPSRSYTRNKPTTITSIKSKVITTTMKPATTTIDPELIGIKPPMPRKIESHQFRRKKVLPITNMNSNYLPVKANQPNFLNTNVAVPLTAEITEKTVLTTIRPLTNKPNTNNNFNSRVNSNYSPYSPKQIFNYQNIQPVYTTMPSTVTTIRPTFNFIPQRNISFLQEFSRNISAIRQDLNLKSGRTEQTTAKPLQGINFAAQNYTTSRPLSNYNYYNTRSSVNYSRKVNETTKVILPSINYIQKPNNTLSHPNIRNTTSVQNEITAQFLQKVTKQSTIPPVLNLYPKSNTTMVQESPKNVSGRTDQTTVKPVARLNFPVYNYYTTVKPSHFLNTYSTRTPSYFSDKMEESTKITLSPLSYTLKLANNSSLQRFISAQTPTQILQTITTVKPTLKVFVPTLTPYYSPKNSNKISNTSDFTNQQPNAVNQSLNSSTTLNKYPTNSLKNLTATNFTNSFITTSYKENKYSNVHLQTQTKSTNAWSHVTLPPINKTQTANSFWKFPSFNYKPLQENITLPASTTSGPVNRSSTIKKIIQNSTKYDDYERTLTPQNPVTTTKAPSIFDLYLRPQKITLPPFQFSPFKSSLNRYQIFSGGTTALPSSNLASNTKTA